MIFKHPFRKVPIPAAIPVVISHQIVTLPSGHFLTTLTVKEWVVLFRLHIDKAHDGVELVAAALGMDNILRQKTQVNIGFPQINPLQDNSLQGHVMSPNRDMSLQWQNHSTPVEVEICLYGYPSNDH